MSVQPRWWRNLKPVAIWYSTRLLNESGGLRVTSGHRTRAQNLKLKGATLNGHTSGFEVDYVGSREAMQRARARALQFGARKALIHDAGTGLHLHVDWRGAP